MLRRGGARVGRWRSGWFKKHRCWRPGRSAARPQRRGKTRLTRGAVKSLLVSYAPGRQVPQGHCPTLSFACVRRYDNTDSSPFFNTKKRKQAPLRRRRGIEEITASDRRSRPAAAPGPETPGTRAGRTRQHHAVAEVVTAAMQSWPGGISRCRGCNAPSAPRPIRRPIRVGLPHVLQEDRRARLRPRGRVARLARRPPPRLPPSHGVNAAAARNDQRVSGGRGTLMTRRTAASGGGGSPQSRPQKLLSSRRHEVLSRARA